MKLMNLLILRSVTALLLGGILVFWSQSAVVYLIMIVGCLFLIPGLISILSYLWARNRGADVRFGFSQILAVGSIFFGISLLINPVLFEKTLMYALGAILVYAGLNEIISLVAAREWTRVPGGFYVIPVLIILLGLFILINPIESANLPFILLGIGCLVYGVTDLVNMIKFRRRNKEVEVVEPEEIL